MLTKTEAKAVVDQWVDSRSEKELNRQAVKSKTKKLEKKLTIYNIPPVGHMEKYKREGRCRIMYSQLDIASTSTVRHVKIDRVHN